MHFVWVFYRIYKSNLDNSPACLFFVIRTLIFIVRDSYLTFDQIVDDLKFGFIWSDCVPCGTIGNNCLKSPANTNVIPFIILSDDWISHSVQSKW